MPPKRMVSREAVRMAGLAADGIGGERGDGRADGSADAHEGRNI